MMTRARQRRLYHTGQGLLIGGLGLAIAWQGVCLWQSEQLAGWWGLGLALLLPGLLLWAGAGLTPHLPPSRPAYEECYRLLYDAPEGWDDTAARRALLALAETGGLEFTWAGEGAGVGCWLAVTGDGAVLERLVADMFPAGRVEPDHPPVMGAGVAVLHWLQAPPQPVELCRLPGVEGVYYCRHSRGAATVAVWGSGAADALAAYIRPEDVVIGQGTRLRRPPFRGDNPWPELPPFPPSQTNPGLAAVSRLERLAPALRVTGPSLRLGHDAAGQPVGFTLPHLAGLTPAVVVGQAAEPVVVSLVVQAVQAGLPVLCLDGRGTAAVQLSRRLLRELAAGQALLCDVERPAQSRFRLNPLWLPPDPASWPQLMTGPWREWLQELGVTAGGLGQVAYRHTLVATALIGLAAVQQGLALEVRSLRDTLAAPDFLPLLGEETLYPGLVDEATRTWWLAEGRQASNFEAHLRLGHLRERLSGLLDLPEYGVLWRGPYLDPLAALDSGLTCLVWRAPDPRRRLRPYLISQLVALAGLLTVWPAERPVLIILHEVEAGSWPRRLAALPPARVIVSSERARGPLAALPQPTALLVSRLKEAAEAQALQPWLPGIPPSDLCRLPPTRLVVQAGGDWGTVDFIE